MNSLQALSVIAAGQGLLISSVLLSLPRGNRAANGWLASYIAVQSIAVLAMFTMSSVSQPPIIATASTIGSTYLTGPLLYFYAQTMTGGRLPPRWQQLLQLLPGLLVLAFVYWQKAVMPDAVRELGWITNFSADERPLRGYQPLIDTPLLGVTGVLTSAAYMLFGLHRFAPFGLRLRHVFSATDKMELRWAQLFITTAMLCSLSAAVPMMLRMAGATEWLPMPNFHLYVPRVALLWLVSMVMFMTIRQSPLFAAGSKAGEAPQPHSQPQKYRTSSLSVEVSEAHWSRLTALMATEHLHRINGLTLAQLAERLGISADHLTQVINTHSGSNFFDFVNGYRIEEAKQLLTDPANRQPLKTIVYAVGFNSQSAFYKQFSRHTGLAPAAFRRAQAGDAGDFTAAQSH